MPNPATRLITFIMTDMSPILIGITVVAGLTEVLILCVVIAAIYKVSKGE
jgi:hypothetical protein